MNINVHLFLFFWDNLTLHLVIHGNANHINSAARLQGDLHCICWKQEIHFSSFIFIKRKIFLFKPFDKKQMRIPGILFREWSCNHPEVWPFTPQFFCLPPLPPSLSAYLHNTIKRAVVITAAPEEQTEYCRFLVGSSNAALHFKTCKRASGVLANSQVYLKCPKVSSSGYCESCVGSPLPPTMVLPGLSCHHRNHQRHWSPSEQRGPLSVSFFWTVVCDNTKA